LGLKRWDENWGPRGGYEWEKHPEKKQWVDDIGTLDDIEEQDLKYHEEEDDKQKAEWE
jgi:hypothetical protein